MGFDEIFENKQSHRGYNREQQYHDDQSYSQDMRQPLRGQDDGINWLNILEKIKNNKKLKLLLVLAGILLLAIGIGLIIFLWPFITKLLNFVSQNGVQGLVDEVLSLINKILNGSGK